MIRSKSLAFVAALALSALAPAQTINVFYPDNVPSTGSSNLFPFNTGNYTICVTYPAAALTAAGCVAGQHLTGVAMAPFTAGSGTFSTTSAQIWIGHAATSPTVPNQWLNNLTGAQPVWNTATDGALTFPWAFGSWAAMPFSANCVFFWDGIHDIVLLTSISGTHTGGFLVMTSPQTIYTRHGVTALFPPPGTTQTTTGVLGPRARFTFDSAGMNPGYQVNQPASSFDVDGVVGNAFSLATDNRMFLSCAAASSNAHLASTSVGLPFDVGLTLGPTLSVSTGAFVLPDGQIANINLADPTLGWLNNFTFTTPFPGNFTIPFSVAFAFDIAAQQVNFDPAHATGVALSQPTQYHATAGSATTAGPSGDDATNTYTLASLPCSPTPISFYGTAFTQISVCTNGRVFLGSTANASFTPGVATSLSDPPFIGLHADLNTAVAGSITINTGAIGHVIVNYNGVGYFGGTNTPTTINTFSIDFDGFTGFATIQGLNGIGLPPSTTTPAFLGVSPGTLGATDPGAQAFFAPSGPVLVPGAFPMMYQFGAINNGTTPLITAGLSNLVFDTNSSGKLWSGT